VGAFGGSEHYLPVELVVDREGAEAASESSGLKVSKISRKRQIAAVLVDMEVTEIEVSCWILSAAIAPLVNAALAKVVLCELDFNKDRGMCRVMPKGDIPRRRLIATCFGEYLSVVVLELTGAGRTRPRDSRYFEGFLGCLPVIAHHESSEQVERERLTAQAMVDLGMPRTDRLHRGVDLAEDDVPRPFFVISKYERLVLVDAATASAKPVCGRRLKAAAVFAEEGYLGHV